MKTIKNLGKVLKKEQQLSINGGSFRCKKDRDCYPFGDTLVLVYCEETSGQCMVG